ncbi:MAG: hypothetical protein JXR12_05950 [Neptunomonas phycophila]|uniref:hypothetical protein n=1 Tax=Neptunomonas phycophila TaxID=1572645 RepID=UPI003B8DCCB9
MKRTYTREEFIKLFLNVEHIRQGVEDMKRFHPDLDVDKEVQRIIDQEWIGYERGY